MASAALAALVAAQLLACAQSAALPDRPLVPAGPGARVPEAVVHALLSRRAQRGRGRPAPADAALTLAGADASPACDACGPHARRALAAPRDALACVRLLLR
jgi:hypothetical protein